MRREAHVNVWQVLALVTVITISISVLMTGTFLRAGFLVPVVF